MTYSSRNFLISCGVGREERVPRFSNRLSSAMMSLQTSTHSSQMKTVGPAMSFRTSFWSLLQNEHRRTSVSPDFFTMRQPCLSARGSCQALLRITLSIIPYSFHLSDVRLLWRVV